MATVFLLSPNSIFPSILRSSSSLPRKQLFIACKAAAGHEQRLTSLVLSKRNFSLCFTTTLLISLSGSNGRSNAAILEADDDVELLEKVKNDKKRRIEKQELIKSSAKETGFVQDIIYKLSKVGQAIDNEDLPAASSVLGTNTDADWVQKASSAFTKLSSSPEEITQVDAFSSSLSTLISSVAKKDAESSKIAFVASATALEKWTALTGLVSQLKGL